MPLSIGELLNNRYRISSIIAQGGMGAVYQAQDEVLGVLVAVKENLFSSEEAARQFRREATILANVRHPNLPRVTDHFLLHGSNQYLVMDFIEGEDLKQRINRLGNLPEEEVLLIGAAICDALNYLHTLTPPVIHRDIKPGNIKITPQGQVFLVDFGLAKQSHAGQVTTVGAQGLTPGYASPEQYGQGTDARSDIYSLGATLYHALTGKTPEDGLSRAMGSAQLTPLRQHQPALSMHIAAVIEKSLEVDANLRYHTAQAFKEALLTSSSIRRKARQPGGAHIQPAPATPPITATILSRPASNPAVPAAAPTRPTPAVPVTPPPTSAHPRRFPWLWVIVPILLGGLLLTGLIVLLPSTLAAPSATPTLTPSATPTLPTPPPEPSATAPLPTQKPPTPLPATPTRTAQPTTPITLNTPIGGSNWIAFASERSGIFQIWVMQSDGSNLRQVTDLIDGACQPDWSPDGQRLVFTSPCNRRQDSYRNSSLYLINLDGSGLTPLVSMPGGDYDPAWSPDGKTIAFTSLRDGNSPHIYLYDLSSNQVQRLTSPNSSDRRAAWSPDGTQIACESTALGKPQIWVMKANGSERREFSILDEQPDYAPTWSRDANVIYYSQGSSLSYIIARRTNQPGANEVRIGERVKTVLNISPAPDDFWLVFESWSDGNHDIFIMSRTGANLTRLTNEPGMDLDPVWQPIP